MKINTKNNIEGIYKSNIQRKAPVSDKGAEINNKQLSRDRIEISKNAAGYDELKTIKAKIAAEVQKGANAEKLHELKNRIETNNYHISSLDIASAMLGLDSNEE
jgi:anti-sigma28 factor (negative regulator of flagellin synthesis)